MLQISPRARVLDLLASADVQVEGDRPWDLRVHDPDLFRRVLLQGSLGLGEAYMDGWWDCEQLDEFFSRVLGAELDAKVSCWPDALCFLRAKLLNTQNGSRAYEVGRRHYDIGNDLYRLMLDRRMLYSCAYWKGASDLDGAQEAKLELIARKLDVRPGMRILDIGCGWGGAAQYLAERYGAQVVGVTVSEEQARHAADRCRGLPVEIHLQDYRSIEDRFDRIFSIGMFEHVGYKNYRAYFEVVRRSLDDEGLSLLHTIGRNSSSAGTDPWIERYIFPNSMLPSAAQIAAASEGLFILEDWHNLGADYDPTLVAWHENFRRSWGELKDRYDERFYRMWTYYLLACAGAFRARKNQLWQLVLSPKGVQGGYAPVR
jgi:cyclopropane-fatty-acyl-phospholipid synthase